MKIFLVFSLAVLAVSTMAQTKDYSKDVGSVDAIVAALYDVISGDPGAPRDWDRFRNLFTPEARLMPTRKNPQGELVLASMAPEDYVQMFTSRITTGFFERELHRVTETYGTVTHVFSTYETKEKKDGPVTNRGVNSIQLFFDGKRFYVVNVFWCAESLADVAESNDHAKDVASAEAIVSALYDVISGDAGVVHDWDRFHNLFKPESRLIPSRKTPEGQLTAVVMSPEDFATRLKARTAGFFEKEISRVTEKYGTVTHVFSTYESREKADGPVVNRGINSFQLFYDGKRFYIVDIFWCAESLGFPLPDKYVK